MNNITTVQPHINVSKEKEKLYSLIETILKKASSQGATQAEVDVGINAGFTVNVRNQSIDTLEYQNDRGLGITVYFGNRKGHTQISDFSEAAIDKAIEAACDIAKYTGADEYNGLADESLMAYDYPDVDAYHPWLIDTSTATQLAMQCEAKAFAVDKRIKNSEGAYVSSIEGLHAYGNSHGFIGCTPTSSHSIGCVLLAESKEGMQRDYEYSSARCPNLLESLDFIATSAAQKTVNRLGAKPIKTQSSPIIFKPSLAKGIIGNFVAAVSGGNLYKRSSFLLDSLHTQVLPKWFNLTEKPHEKKALGSAPFDSEGVLTKEAPLVDKGILQHYVLSSYSARKLNMAPTGNAGGVNNLIVGHNDVSFKDLLKQMGTGFLVTEMIGHGVNIVTGDYSRGAAGFWVENGEITKPVEEVTIAGNLKDMLLNIESIANDVDKRSNIQSGSMLIKSMQIAGK